MRWRTKRHLEIKLCDYQKEKLCQIQYIKDIDVIMWHNMFPISYNKYIIFPLTINWPYDCME